MYYSLGLDRGDGAKVEGKSSADMYAERPGPLIRPFGPPNAGESYTFAGAIPLKWGEGKFVQYLSGHMR